MKQILVLVIFLFFMSCSTSENQNEIPTANQEESNNEEEMLSGNLLFTIKVPDNAVRKDINKLHYVLYDSNNEVLAYNTHVSGIAESLKFYADMPLENDAIYSLSRITNFQESVFTIRLYMDLTGTQLSNGIQLQDNTADRKTNLLDLPITSIQEEHSLIAQGSGYSLVTIDEKLSGHFSSNYANSLATENIYIQYFDNDGISDYKYLFTSSQNLKALNAIDASIFIDEGTRYSYVNFYKPFSRTLIRINGFEDESRFSSNISHTIHTSNNLSDYGGARYSYSNIFPKYLSSVQLDNYEVQQVGLPPEDLVLPELNVDYSYDQGHIIFNGISKYETLRFLLRSNAEIHVTTIIVADGDRTELTIPEVPADLFSVSVMEGLQVSNLSIQQGAAENYEGYETYTDYITNTLFLDKPYYLSAPKRERIFKSSVSPQLLPF